MARLLRCTKRRRQETAGPAPPHPPTRTGRQQPLGDLGTAPPPRLLGVPYMRIARATGSRSPKQHWPAVYGLLPSYTLPGYSVPWTRTLSAARRPSPTRPPAPACPQQHRWPEGRAAAEDSSRLRRRLASRRESGRLPAEPLAAAVDLEVPSSTACVAGPTQRPLVRAAAPAAPAPVSGTDWKPARFFREGRCSAHIGASVRTCRGEGLKRAPAAAALTKRGRRRRDHGAGPDGGTRRRDQTSGPHVGTTRRDHTSAAPKTSLKKQLVVQEIFPCA